jgi:chloride channel 3/4/5
MCYFTPDVDPHEAISLYPWMNETPLTVKPNFPMSSLVDMFSKMGLRFVLVTKQGRLLGLVTKKDVLAYVQSSSQ